jgi:colanic acid/amylovoran biosynthesis protein
MVRTFKGAPTFTEAFLIGARLAGNTVSAFIFRISGLRVLRNDTLDDFIDADLILYAGGGYLHPDYGFFRPCYDFMLAKILGKKVMMYSQSMGPFDGVVRKTLMKEILARMDLILLREDESARHLEDIGVKDFHITADSAFSFPHKKYGNPKKPELTVIMCPGGCPYSKRDSLPGYKRFIISLARRFSETGAKIILMPTATKDAEFHKHLKTYMPEGVECIDDILPPEEAAKILSRADFLITSRMHAIILGSASATPFFAIGWEYKFGCLAEALSCPTCFLDASEVKNDDVDKVMMEFDRRKILRARVKRNFIKMKKKALMNRQILGKKLAELGFEIRR